ncbi:hypothetical protein PC111_g18430 [Phytophthora cactorum]|nr:hypothetical protein PC111_g18430 [Phytophthora cactorum]KAG2878736.1 hypothetical protein PC114_g22930 [Phytophthora cactorum]KAG3063160.1 hypothetical protein PC122_g18971 [Phytophthora cactorum]
MDRRTSLSKVVVYLSGACALKLHSSETSGCSKKSVSAHVSPNVGCSNKQVPQQQNRQFGFQLEVSS